MRGCDLRFLLLFFFPIFCLSAQEDSFRDPTTQIIFPYSIIAHSEGKTYKLQATGCADRTKFIVNIYCITHYWEDPIRGSEQEILEGIFKDDKAKQFIIQWTRDVNLSRIRDTFYETFDKGLEHGHRHHLQNEIDHFVLIFDEDARRNDVHIIRWLPGGRVQVVLKGFVKGEVVSSDFAKALWKIWLGPHSIVNRHQLISFIISDS